MQTALTANGAGPAIDWPGGSGTFSARGTFGGATAVAQFCPGNSDPGVSGNWLAVANCSFTAPSDQNISLGRGKLRVMVSNVGSTSIAYDFLGFMGGPSGFS